MLPKLTVSFLVAGAGILIFYFYPDVLHTFYSRICFGQSSLKYMAKLLPFINLGITPSDTSSSEENEKKNRMFTIEELRHYDGSADSSGLYLAILGEVFDVQKGAQHYKPGAGYSFFTGRDATRAYVTGDFSEVGLTDYVNDLDDSSLVSIEDWLNFYRDEYPFVGKLVGRYYNKKGNPNAELQEVLKRMNKGRANKYKEEKEKENFPPCNSEWSREKGSKVWCSEKSGGIDRDWVGVPRQFFKVGYDPRCVCVRNVGPPSSAPDSTDHMNRGDLDHPSLQDYPSCPADSVSCMVDHP